ncbi:hypothetical protein [Streptomyces sp. 5-6(2022)]|uniref:hypothetical protein n=1 Tax=Streptomyces sp. 5-6(2022) TaxID=2936510 RepID=UPI0023B8E3EA|nr:hypothetical protein [Streptomyces sp. 5-6(2022)]
MTTAPHSIPQPNLNLRKPVEGAVVEHHGEIVKQNGDASWMRSKLALAERAKDHALDNKLYAPWAGRGYRNLARRWLEAYRDDHPQMIATAKADRKAAKGNTTAEAGAHDLVKERRAEYRRHRLIHLGKTAGWSVAGAAGTTVGAVTGGLWVDLAMTIAAYTTGIYHGRPGANGQPDMPLPSPEQAAGSDAPAITDDSRRPTDRRPARPQGEEDLVTVLIKAGIVTEAQRDETRLTSPIRTNGPGWTATVELPPGMKASAATSKAADIASALRVKKTRIELKADTSDEGHEGQFVLWVADNDNPYGTGKKPSQLIEAERWNFWRDGVPLGGDARGMREVLHLMWSSLMVGGLQDYGKSYLARLIAAAAALDPHMRIVLITGKAGPDWAPLKGIAHAYIAGSSPDRLVAVHDILDETIIDMQDRGERLERLFEEDPAACPEGKVTSEMARQPGSELTLVIVDELQELLDAAALTKVKVGDEEEGGGRGRSGKDVLVEKFARFVRVARYVGGMGVFITQRPDSDSVPTKLRDVCVKRGCFRVKGAGSSRMVLGDDVVAAGAAPHLLGEASKGVVVLEQGADEGHVTLKTDVIDLPDFKAICERGRSLREEAGTLTGAAVRHGERASEAAESVTLRSDCLHVFDAAGVERLRPETLTTWLKERRPEVYANLTPESLKSMLRAAGVGSPVPLGAMDGLVNPRGYKRESMIRPARP